MKTLQQAMAALSSHGTSPQAPQKERPPFSTGAGKRQLPPVVRGAGRPTNRVPPPLPGPCKVLDRDGAAGRGLCCPGGILQSTWERHTGPSHAPRLSSCSSQVGCLWARRPQHPMQPAPPSPTPTPRDLLPSPLSPLPLLPAALLGTCEWQWCLSPPPPAQGWAAFYSHAHWGTRDPPHAMPFPERSSLRALHSQALADKRTRRPGGARGA